MYFVTCVYFYKNDNNNLNLRTETHAKSILDIIRAIKDSIIKINKYNTDSRYSL